MSAPLIFHRRDAYVPPFVLNNFFGVEMEYPEHYKTLELPISATEKDVKLQYRRLAKKYHPDLHPDDKQAEEKFKKINEAYEILGNSEKRAEYDTTWRRQKEEELAEKMKHSAVVPTEKTAEDYQDSVVMQNYIYRSQLRKYRLILVSRIVSMFMSLSILFAMIFMLAAKDFPQFMQNVNNVSEKLISYIHTGSQKLSDLSERANKYFAERSIVSAVKEGNQVDVMNYLNTGENPNITEEQSGYSLLMLSPDEHITRLLIGFGANVNYAAPDGNTALSVAVDKNNLEIAKLLIAAGANVNYTDKSNNYSLLMNTDDIKMYYLLLQNGANPNYVAPDGISPLYLASAEQNQQKITALREHGAQVKWHDIRKSQ